ncbi:MAG: histidinol dehydrogenase [Myxococcales bacterium]|nr:histidinol dehydrogenase [Myxococcales bacterium]HIK83573.1 histidinol dehydrogenase [Myxococcales bacterium]
MAAKATAKQIRVIKTDSAKFADEWLQVCSRREDSVLDVEADVAKIVSGVRTGGDEALFGFIKKFDHAKLDVVEVANDEWDDACDAVDSADRAAIGKAAMRVREFHRKRIPSSWEMREEGGGYMGQRVRPLARVGIYVPGGKAVYPSTVVMNAIPASVVEVPEIVMATPPGKDGSIRPEVLMAARVAGVHRVFKMGGAHAVAAMAYGTESVPVVDKIVGPGNVWVATAKKQVFGQVGIDSEAGPTEVCIVADRSATPAWLAADLISQAEHDELAQSVLITHVKGLVTRVQEQLKRQLAELDRREIATTSIKNRGAIIVTKNLAESMRLADEYAPEHLVLAVEDPETTSKTVQNAGAIFLGHYTPVAVGDYIAGPNHVIPTGGTARFFSPLSVEDFLKRTSFMKFEPPKLRELGADIVRLSNIEGLTGHGASVELRLQKIRRARREREAAREAEL